MMKKLILILVALMPLPLLCQKTETGVITGEKTIGIRLTDSSDIKGTELLFNERIQWVSPDTTTGFLTLLTRGLSKNGKWLDNNGSLLQYDMNNGKILWSRPFNYLTGNLQQLSGALIMTVNNKSYCLDVLSGEEKWEVKNNIYLADPQYNIGIGYKFRTSTGYTNELEGIDLADGTVKWRRDLNREYSWNDAFFSNDSTLIILAAGIHALDPRSGEGWDYNTLTGKKDYRETAAVNALGVAAGLLTGNFFMATGSNLVRDMISNVIADSSSFYFASAERIARIDRFTGRVIWEYPFPGEIASNSVIFINDTLVCMINKGMANMGAKQISIGKPFVAAFGRHDGKSEYFSLIASDDDPVLSSANLNGEIWLVFKNRIMKFSVENGEITAQKDFTAETFGELRYFIGSQVFTRMGDGTLVGLTGTDTTKMFVYNSQGKIFSIDPVLEVADTLEASEMGIRYLWYDNYYFIYLDGKTYVIDIDGQPVAVIDASSGSFIEGNKFYSKNEKSIIAVDIESILPDRVTEVETPQEIIGSGL